MMTHRDERVLLVARPTRQVQIDAVDLVLLHQLENVHDERGSTDSFRLGQGSPITVRTTQRQNQSRSAQPTFDHFRHGRRHGQLSLLLQK